MPASRSFSHPFFFSSLLSFKSHTLSQTSGQGISALDLKSPHTMKHMAIEKNKASEKRGAFMLSDFSKIRSSKIVVVYMYIDN